MRLESFHLAGANLNQVDPSGRTALQAATESCHRAAVEFLLDLGVNSAVKNIFGFTPLETAKLMNYTEIANLFLSLTPVNSLASSPLNCNGSLTCSVSN